MGTIVQISMTPTKNSRLIPGIVFIVMNTRAYWRRVLPCLYKYTLFSAARHHITDVTDYEGIKYIHVYLPSIKVFYKTLTYMQKTLYYHVLPNDLICHI